MQISAANSKSELGNTTFSRQLAAQEGYDSRPDVIDDRILMPHSLESLLTKAWNAYLNNLSQLKHVLNNEEGKRRENEEREQEYLQIVTQIDQDASTRLALTCAFRRGAMSQHTLHLSLCFVVL